MDGDKENIALAPHTADAAATAPTKQGAAAPPRPKAPLAAGTVSFPSTSKPGELDQDQDTDATAPEGQPRRSALFYPSSALAAKSNQKPFSRSAAKRDSVMALGSIGYLQHLYAKQGIASKTRPLTKGPMTLAIGLAGETMLASTPESPSESPTLSKASLRRGASDGQGLAEDGLVLVTSPDDQPIELPPSPKAPTSTRLPYPVVPKPVEADPEALWPMLLQDLDTTCQLWGLLNLVKRDKASPSGGRRLSIEPDSRRPSSRSSMYSTDGLDDAALETQPIDLLELINATTKTIRSVRSYLLALPPASLSGKRISENAPGSKPKDQFKRQSSFGSLSRRSSLSPLPLEKTYGSLSRRVSSPQGGSPGSTRAMPSAWQAPGSASSPSTSPADSTDVAEDPLTLVRKSALDVLSTLRELEEKHRLPPGHPDYEKAEAETASLGEESALGINLGSKDNRMPPAPGLRSLTSLANPSSLDLGLNGSPDKGSGEGYLYQTDLKLSDLGKEREFVNSYLTTVDRVLSVVQKLKPTKRPSARLALNAEAEPSPEPSGANAAPGITVDAARVGNDATDAAHDVPAWARKGEFQGGEIDGFELLQVSTEVTQSDNVLDISKDQLLDALVDGSMLCHAYNAALRQSSRPWGFIQPKEIHDLKAAEADALEKQKMLLKKAEAEPEAFQVKDKSGKDRRGASDASFADRTETDQKSAAASPEGLKKRPGWTFRKAENLRVWAAALRLRYHIQTTSMSSLESLNQPVLPGLQPPVKLGLHPRRVYSEAAASSSSLSLASTDSGRESARPSVAGSRAGHVNQGAIEFDPKRVARKEEGWEQMLYNLVVRWVHAVASEERGEDAR
ncbi:uncharacterized protein PFL1_06837 [Pseudozyma flocculosa PF-1]|uniref:uncharacterized protein n=1 Tax=Pseudozyma flocculosa PF-1 TaxID=1277687 RepID=UPI00045612CE|nr:uncharacterized protein PFL1_06837 [Pseudozyma flocculosa PF-1]EPQ31482.1 hypothetical protein PFL1_06837 [Pseudozyma flocculosa PF-1]